MSQQQGGDEMVMGRKFADRSMLVGGVLSMVVGFFFHEDEPTTGTALLTLALLGLCFLPRGLVILRRPIEKWSLSKVGGLLVFYVLTWLLAGVGIVIGWVLRDVVQKWLS